MLTTKSNKIIKREASLLEACKDYAMSKYGYTIGVDALEHMHLESYKHTHMYM